MDEDLLEQLNRLDVPCGRVTEPQQISVVLGRSCQAEKEVYMERCVRDGVLVSRRLGGGCSVVMAPGMLAISVAYRTAPVFNSTEQLSWLTQPILDVLLSFGVGNLSVQGVSDLCIKDKKVMGSCLSKSQAGYLFQASLLVDCDTGLVERYLQMPARMPVYRNGRSHHLFVTTLKEEGCLAACGELMGPIREELGRVLDHSNPCFSSTMNRGRCLTSS
jgi:lipoate-protein ligase A